MLIQFADVLKPYSNLRRRHVGLVVDVKDPQNQGRIKCKVQGLIETSETDDIPWFYPDQRSSRGGRPDSMVSAVPPLWSMVEVEFPAFGDDPKIGGNVYYPTYCGMVRNAMTTSPIAGANATPQDSSLSQPNGGSASGAENIEANIWAKTSGAVAWIRIDRAMGSIEVFDSDTGATLRLDRGGHLQCNVTSLDMNVKEDVRWKVGGVWHQQVTGDTILDCRADTFVNTDNNLGLKAGENIDSSSGQSWGINAGQNLEVIAGQNIGMNAGQNYSLTVGSNYGVQAQGTIGLSAQGAASFTSQGAMSLTTSQTLALGAASQIGISAGSTVGIGSGASVSIVSATIPIEGLILMNTGAAGSPATGSAVGGLDSAQKLGTVDSLTSNLGNATSTLSNRFSGLASVVSYFAGQAKAAMQAGQQVATAVQNWANSLTGSDLG